LQGGSVSKHPFHVAFSLVAWESRSDINANSRFFLHGLGDDARSPFQLTLGILADAPPHVFDVKHAA
jgi:hypothetical protein